jgi:hypothetical protein
MLENQKINFPTRQELKSIRDNKVTKKETYREWNGLNYKSTGCMAVDMVIQCTDFYRKQSRPLKSITLSNSYYEDFDDYMRVNHMKGKEYEEQRDGDYDARPYTIDGVPIKRAGILLIKDMKCEFFPTFQEGLLMPRHIKAEGKINIDLPKTSDTFEIQKIN